MTEITLSRWDLGKSSLNSWNVGGYAFYKWNLRLQWPLESRKNAPDTLYDNMEKTIYLAKGRDPA